MKILPKIIVIVGPTAAGKSALAIKIARLIANHDKLMTSQVISLCDGAEIISADSRQIYRGMDIGTAKPPLSPARRSRADAKSSALAKAGAQCYSRDIRHHLIDIRNPDEEYTAADFKKDAIRAINDITKRKKLPILVGGTGLYVKTVTENLDISKAKSNKKLREKLEKKLQENGLAALYKKLLDLDPEAAYIVDPHNPRRVIRALEITLETQKPFSQQRTRGERLFDVLKIGVDVPSDELRRRINRRVDHMIKNGLIAEVRNLLKKYPATLPAFDAIGYREIIRWLNRRKSISRTSDVPNITSNNSRTSDVPESPADFDTAVQIIKQNTWHFAKRQRTWFRADKEIRWLRTEKEARKLVCEFLG